MVLRLPLIIGELDNLLLPPSRESATKSYSRRGEDGVAMMLVVGRPAFREPAVVANSTPNVKTRAGPRKLSTPPAARRPSYNYAIFVAQEAKARGPARGSKDSATAVRIPTTDPIYQATVTGLGEKMDTSLQPLLSRRDPPVRFSRPWTPPVDYDSGSLSECR